ncbi:hypothetical protein P5V15_003525 [Pogonomyrmex californicus]
MVLVIIYIYNSNNRRVPYANIPSDWRALWFSNLDELQRVNDANDNNTVSNVTVQLGGTAFLHCKVRNLAERTVSDAEISWIRRRDFHVLTSSLFTYTNDERFQVLHPEGSDDWTLQIKYVQERDNGTYECQVSRFEFKAVKVASYVNLLAVRIQSMYQLSRVLNYDIFCFAISHDKAIQQKISRKEKSLATFLIFDIVATNILTRKSSKRSYRLNIVR